MEVLVTDLKAEIAAPDATGLAMTGKWEWQIFSTGEFEP